MKKLFEPEGSLFGVVSFNLRNVVDRSFNSINRSVVGLNSVRIFNLAACDRINEINIWILILNES